jgi:hypothetical protein
MSSLLSLGQGAYNQQNCSFNPSQPINPSSNPLIPTAPPQDDSSDSTSFNPPPPFNPDSIQNLEFSNLPSAPQLYDQQELQQYFNVEKCGTFRGKQKLKDLNTQKIYVIYEKNGDGKSIGFEYKGFRTLREVQSIVTLALSFATYYAGFGAALLFSATPIGCMAVGGITATATAIGSLYYIWNYNDSDPEAQNSRRQQALAELRIESENKTTVREKRDFFDQRDYQKLGLMQLGKDIDVLYSIQALSIEEQNFLNQYVYSQYSLLKPLEEAFSEKEQQLKRKLNQRVHQAHLQYSSSTPVQLDHTLRHEDIQMQVDEEINRKNGKGPAHSSCKKAAIKTVQVLNSFAVANQAHQRTQKITHAHNDYDTQLNDWKKQHQYETNKNNYSEKGIKGINHFRLHLKCPPHGSLGLNPLLNLLNTNLPENIAGFVQSS